MLGNTSHSDLPTSRARGWHISRSASALTYRNRHWASRKQNAAGMLSRNRTRSAPECSPAPSGGMAWHSSTAQCPHAGLSVGCSVLERRPDRHRTVDDRQIVASRSADAKVPGNGGGSPVPRHRVSPTAQIAPGLRRMPRMRQSGPVTGDEGVPPSGELLVQAVEGMERPLFVLDADWRFRYINPAGARVLDHTVDGLLGRDVWA